MLLELCEELDFFAWVFLLYLTAEVQSCLVHCELLCRWRVEFALLYRGGGLLRHLPLSNPFRGGALANALGGAVLKKDKGAGLLGALGWSLADGKLTVLLAETLLLGTSGHH